MNTNTTSSTSSSIGVAISQLKPNVLFTENDVITEDMYLQWATANKLIVANGNVSEFNWNTALDWIESALSVKAKKNA